MNLDKIHTGNSPRAGRARQAQRRERIALSKSKLVPCEQCGREYCLFGDFLGSNCRNKRGPA